MSEPSIQLKALVDELLPEQVEPMTGAKRALVRWTLYILGFGLVLGAVGFFIDSLALAMTGFIIALLAMFPAIFVVFVVVADWSERRNRPRERAALFAGEYQHVKIVTTRITSGVGAGSEGVAVHVKPKTGSDVVIPLLGDTDNRADHIARTLVTQMTPERREQVEIELFGQALRQ